MEGAIWRIDDCEEGRGGGFGEMIIERWAGEDAGFGGWEEGLEGLRMLVTERLYIMALINGNENFDLVIGFFVKGIYWKR